MFLRSSSGSHDRSMVVVRPIGTEVGGDALTVSNALPRFFSSLTIRVPRFPRPHRDPMRGDVVFDPASGVRVTGMRTERQGHCRSAIVYVVVCSC